MEMRPGPPNRDRYRDIDRERDDSSSEDSYGAIQPNRRPKPPFIGNNVKVTRGKDLMRTVFLNDITIDEIRRDIASINIYYDELSYTYISEKPVSYY
jgi:hypothetical protein